MTEIHPTQRTDVTTEPPVATAWVGWIFFAATMLWLLGSFQAIAGFVALFDRSYYRVRTNSLAVHLGYTGWGWIHIGLGILAIFAGYAVLMGRMWARVYAIVLAGLSAIANLAFARANPFWSVIIITVDMLVIWAVAVHGHEVVAEE